MPGAEGHRPRRLTARRYQAGLANREAPIRSTFLQGVGVSFFNPACLPVTYELLEPMKFPDRDQEQSKGETPLPAVSAQTLARCLGVSPKVVYDLTKAGLLEHGAGRMYSLEDSVRRYCDHIRRQAT
jgi:hypothetical protein